MGSRDEVKEPIPGIKEGEVTAFGKQWMCCWREGVSEKELTMVLRFIACHGVHGMVRPLI